MRNISQRLEALEQRTGRRPPASSSWAREHMKEHLDRIAASRRGELTQEEEAEVEAASAAIQRRMAEIGGEGAS